MEKCRCFTVYDIEHAVIECISHLRSWKYSWLLCFILHIHHRIDSCGLLSVISKECGKYFHADGCVRSIHWEKWVEIIFNTLHEYGKWKAESEIINGKLQNKHIYPKCNPYLDFNDPIARDIYHKLREKIERTFKLIYFALIKISAAAVTLPTIVISYVNFYVIGLNADESFILPSPMM